MANGAKVPLLVAESKQTGDNAVMIAFAAFVDPAGVVVDGDSLEVNPSWKVA